MNIFNLQELSKRNVQYLLLIAFVSLSSFIIIKKQTKKPTLFLIGDSTVKNGRGNGDGGLWGWGNFISSYFDTTKISVENDALGGTSSRTFQTNGLWDKVLDKVKPGDYVIMQFGHNDGSRLDDTARARGTIKGNTDESKEIYNPIKKQQEVVYTYGWYIRKFIKDTKAKGAVPIVCSLIPRNSWREGKVNRASSDYGLWALEAAKQENAYFIDLNKLIADRYDTEGEEKVKSVYFNTTDHTHTIEAGAKLNAAMVVEGIRSINDLKLNSYLK
jgi:rhamnogalacturonan acetylesterase